MFQIEEKIAFNKAEKLIQTRAAVGTKHAEPTWLAVLITDACGTLWSWMLLSAYLATVDMPYWNGRPRIYFLRQPRQA